MPKVKLPTTGKGWLAVLVASAVGFISGTVTLSIIGKVYK